MSIGEEPSDHVAPHVQQLFLVVAAHGPVAALPDQPHAARRVGTLANEIPERDHDVLLAKLGTVEQLTQLVDAAVHVSDEEVARHDVGQASDGPVASMP